MINKCNGCGALLQSDNNLVQGYTKNVDNLLCERCFRIKNYGDYQMIDKSNDDFIPILNNINKTNDLVLLVVDLLNIPSDMELINNYLNNNIILVLTKRDLLPESLYEEKLLNYIKGNYIDRIIVSSINNYHFDELMEMINQYKKSDKVYVVGYTNAGKSTMINKLIYNYSDIKYEITTSILPSTTLDTIEIKLNEDLTIIDTPGILSKGSIINYVNGKTLKHIMPKKRIKPITYNIKAKQYFQVEDLLLVEALPNNSFTFYMSNALRLERIFKEPSTKLEKHIINANNNNDIVIEGFLFIKIKKSALVTMYAPIGVSVYTRESLI